jgi:catechol 2,3-dioxygenase-like lactoylglutathione lyase family enzyme
MIRGVHHVALSTADLDRLSAFYTDVLGFTVAMKSSWRNRPVIDALIGLKDSAARQVMLQAGNAYIEIFEYESPRGKPIDPARPPSDHGFTHFCLDVQDIDSEFRRLSAAGMTFNCAPPTLDELGGRAIRAIYGRDPDGNIIELQEIMDPSLKFSLESAPMIASGSARGSEAVPR